MKTTNFIATIAIALMLTGTGSLFAQPSKSEMKKTEFHKEMHNGIPNMTEDQKAKMKDLHVAFYKEVQPLRNQLGELKARQKTLSTLDNPDMKAINANIDEITKVMNQLMKSRAAFRQKVRALLTDEQKVWFDSHPMHKNHRGMREPQMGRGHMEGHQMGRADHMEEHQTDETHTQK